MIEEKLHILFEKQKANTINPAGFNQNKRVSPIYLVSRGYKFLIAELRFRHALTQNCGDEANTESQKGLTGGKSVNRINLCLFVS